MSICSNTQINAVTSRGLFFGGLAGTAMMGWMCLMELAADIAITGSAAAAFIVPIALLGAGLGYYSQTSPNTVFKQSLVTAMRYGALSGFALTAIVGVAGAIAEGAGGPANEALHIKDTAEFSDLQCSYPSHHIGPCATENALTCLGNATLANIFVETSNAALREACLKVTSALIIAFPLLTFVSASIGGFFGCRAGLDAERPSNNKADLTEELLPQPQANLNTV